MSAQPLPPLDDPQPLASNRRTSAFERRVGNALARLGVERHSDSRVVVAVSGGADSLATLIASTRALGAGRVTAAHFDHRLRTPAETARDLEVVSRAVRWLATESLDVGLLHGRASRRPLDASEAGARDARYRWLIRACREAGATVCVTGHTLDDQAETVLLRLVRGAGALGAAGMQADAPWPLAARGSRPLRVLRPLLEVTRAEVEAYLDALGVEPSQDATNDTLDYARNRLRHQVMPVLREMNPRAGEHLAEFASLQSEDDLALTGLAAEWLAAHMTSREDGADRVVTLARGPLRELPVALQSRVIREAAGSIGVELEGRHVRAIVASLEKNRATVDLPLARSRVCGKLLELRTQMSHPGTP